MAIKTYTEQLEEVQAAITAVMAGQQYSLSTPDGSQMAVTKADLDALNKREQWLRMQVDRESASGIRIRGATPT